MRLFRPSLIGGYIYPEALFRKNTADNLLYLTFDDGPFPGSTSKYLDVLARYQVKATFFCVGKAAEKNPDLIERIKADGHKTGNHGYEHLDGWKTPDDKYIADIDKAALFTSSDIFRPPHGHLKMNQYRRLKEKYRIVFWDIMPYDFDSDFGSVKSFHILKKKIRPGSIIVLHDDPKSSAMEFMEDFINLALNEGYRFDNFLDSRSGS